jgi:hypothetical protein
MPELRAGDVVRSLRWADTAGVVTARDGAVVRVAWHGTCVEDEVGADEVEVWADAPGELAGWRGGIGVAGVDGSMRVWPVGGEG